MATSAWAGVAIGALGLVLRLWAVLRARHRYTRTLLIQENHSVERGGAYRFVRHPGYLGSLMTLNGIAAAGRFGADPYRFADRDDRGLCLSRGGGRQDARGGHG